MPAHGFMGHLSALQPARESRVGWGLVLQCVHDTVLLAVMQLSAAGRYVAQLHKIPLVDCELITAGARLLEGDPGSA